ncbi:hypothetical protein DMUE_4045 [Dictyocoela muelleri]|nr:hypothetical protein DMUE_4045 [Dictyocoela muelleri]
MAIISEILSYEYKDKIENSKDPNKALDNIIKIRYNKDYAERFQSKLLRIKEEYYCLNKFYLNELSRIIKVISECNNWSSKESEILLESKIFENITIETRMNMHEFEK